MTTQQKFAEFCEMCREVVSGSRGMIDHLTERADAIGLQRGSLEAMAKHFGLTIVKIGRHGFCVTK